jgi:hypothetical protein
MALLDFLFKKQNIQTQTVIKDNFPSVISLNFGYNNYPVITESKNKEWVNFGEDNNYPDMLIDLFNQCSINQSIITQKSKMINGGGYTYNDNNLDASQKVELQKMLNFIDNENSIEVFINLLSGDWELFGAMAIEVIWSRDFSRITSYKRVKPSYIRSGKKEDGKVSKYYYSQNWMSVRNNPPTEIAAFDPNDNTNYNQLIYLKKYSPSTEYYGLPGYASAMNYIQADVQIAQYHNNNIANGFAPGLMINFTKKPGSQEERDIIVSELKKNYQGARNAGRPLVFFSDGAENRTIIEQVGASDLDKQFEVVHRQIIEQICSAHRLTSTELMGIAIPGRLGNSNLEIAYNIFENTVIKPERDYLSKVINDLFRYNGLFINFELLPLNILISNE